MKPSLTKISIYEYTALNNEEGTRQLLQHEQYKHKPSNFRDAALMLADIVQRDGEKGLRKIAQIHPDKDLILKSQKENIIYAASGEETNGKRVMSEKTLNILIWSGMGLLAVVTVVTIISQISKK